MNTISSVGQQMLLFQRNLAVKHHYKPVEPNLFNGDVRTKYLENLPDWCVLAGAEQPLFTTQETKVASGYSRVVIGDYGAFLEISPKQILSTNIKCEIGQEYRFEPRYREQVKYLWLTAIDYSHCKIYQQLRTVSYADYRPGMFYVSPYEVFPTK